LIPIAASGAPLIIGVASVSGAQALPPEGASASRVNRRCDDVRRKTDSSPASKVELFGTSPNTMMRSRKPTVCGTALPMPLTTIAPAMPLPTS
jgi:hypothetical protein